MNSRQREILNDVVKILAPPPELTVSQWADRNRVLSPESSASPGSWDTSLVEFSRGIMDAATDPDIEIIVIKKSAQITVTEIMNNIIGYHIDQDPCPMLMVQPTDEMAKDWSKDRLSPMIRDTECLREKVKVKKTRDSDNTLRHKVFPGGHLTVAISNSPASLASRPIRILLLDEINRYPPSTGSEGDPIAIAMERTETFWNRKIVMGSTPTIKGFSKISDWYDKSDQRMFYVPCPICGHYQILRWAGVTWQKNEKTKEHLPQTAEYECEKCSIHWNDLERWHAVRNGQWRKTAQKDTNIAGFFINRLYSPWSTLEKIVTTWLGVKDNPVELKTFINLYLAEDWEEKGKRLDGHRVFDRREPYKSQVPAGGLVLTCGVDVQDNRIEGEVKAYGHGRESWGVEYFIIPGDPSSQTLWEDLDRKLMSEYSHESGITMRIVCTAIDSGGHFTDQVYNFCRTREYRRIFAIKGSNQSGMPIISRPSRSNKGKVLLYMIGTDTAKELIYAWLSKKEEGPGYMHFPQISSYDEEYFAQLTVEVPITKYKKGYPYIVWEKKEGQRNEALDINVYALAALEILNPNFKLIEENMQLSLNKPDPEAEEKKPVNLRRPQNNWIYGWKK